jgi:drug/metabolite transporter (DMT)-like permease
MSLPIVAIVLLSALIHALWSVFIKGSRNPLAFNVIQALPLCLIFVALLPMVELRGLSSRFWWLLAATGVFHALYLYWLSRALELGDLSLVYPIARSTPAFLPLFAGPLLGEVITPIGAAGIATVVAGMWSVQLGGAEPGRPSRPGPWWRRLARPELTLADLTLATTVGYGLTDKALMSDLAGMEWSGPVPRSLFCFFALWLPTALLFVPLALRRLTLPVIRQVLRDEWWRAATAGSISVVGYGLILKALETSPASYVVAVRQSSVLFVLLMSVVVLGERPGVLRALGAVATVAGVALIAVAG